VQIEETRNESNKNSVDKLTIILEEVIELCNSEKKMTNDEIIKLEKYYLDQI
jgi:plasmid maintenance system antidote protein VapI